MRLTLALCVLLTTTACATISQSRLNPLNWFGRSQVVATTPEQAAARPLVVPGDTTVVVDNRQLISQVTALRVDRTPTGAIVTAEGVAPGAGFFNAQLVRRSLQNGVLTLEFRAEAPPAAVATPTNATRTITVATDIEADELIGIRTIVVQGASGSRQVSR